MAYPDTLDYGVNATLLDACDLPQMDVDSPAWSAHLLPQGPALLRPALTAWGLGAGHSAHCASFAYVRNRAQSVLAIYSPVRTAFTLIMFPTAGVVADVIGRKPVLIAASCDPPPRPRLLASIFTPLGAAEVLGAGR